MALSDEDLAANYGFALAFMKSDKELWGLFKKASDPKNSWTVQRFVAGLKNTGWYKKKSESVRQYELLRTTDPATLAQRRQQMDSQIHDLAAQMGASFPSGSRSRIVDNALKYGWNENQIRDTVAGFIRTVNGVYNGQAGSNIESLRQTAWRNGINMAPTTLQNYARQIAMGNAGVKFYQDLIRKQAKSLAPSFAAEIDAGMDLYDIANPYIQAKAKILEKNPADIDLFDNDVRKALSGKDAAGKPSTMSLWQFEQSLRKNPEWNKTQNAQDSMMSTARKVLQDFGFQA